MAGKESVGAGNERRQRTHRDAQRQLLSRRLRCSARRPYGQDSGCLSAAGGIRGVLDASVPSETDARTGLPIHSLYGTTRRPTAEMLAGIDALVIDLQDVGSRYSTFVWTALLVARVCAAKGVEAIVCDRPNPLGGELVEGAPQLAAERSFVGLRSVPVRHGLTVGELVRAFVAP